MNILEAKLVPQPRCLFVVLAGDGFAELGPQAEPLYRTRALPGALAHMPGGSVHPLEQGKQPASKDPVILRAAEPALPPEIP